MIPILLERKVAAGSVAAALTSGLVALAVFVGKKVGIEIDPAVATPVATTVVVFVVTLLAGYLAKHTERPDLDETLERWVGIEELEPSDAYEPRHAGDDGVF